MATGLEIVTDALRALGYLGANVPLESDDGNLALSNMNDMLSAWEGTEMGLGFVPIANIGDTVRIPRYSVQAVKLNLAGFLSAPFKTPITTELSNAIAAANEIFLRANVNIGEPDLPSTLPMGSGSRCYDDDEIFYSGSDEANF